jgi:hypothetical protein
VDPVDNNILVPVTQSPPTATGSAGLLIYHDPAPIFTGTSSADTQQAASQATLSAVGNSGVSGTAAFSLRRRNMNVDGSLSGVPANSQSVLMVVESAAGHETIPCTFDTGTGKGFCEGYLMGDPLVGAPVNVSVNGTRVASGTISVSATVPTFISIEAATTAQ